MFDDLKQEQNQNQSTPSQQQENKAPAIPAKPAVDDMFSSTDPIKGQTLEKPSAVQSGLVKPVTKTELPKSTEPIVKQPSGPTPPANMAMPSSNASGGGGMKRILIIVVAFLLVAVVSYGAYYFFFRDTGNSDVVENQNSNISNQNTNDNVDIPTEEELDDDSDGLSNAEESVLGTNPLETDTDNDGLFDREEVRSFKTSPTNADTDGDGLSDYNEIKRWFTNPLEIDTDGDGYGDGEEVLNQYDPLGPGKLDNAEGDIKYIAYVDENFSYSIERPDDWVDIYKDKQEPTPIFSVDFLPHIGSSEYITVRIVQTDYDDQEEFRSVLPVEFDWSEYDLNGTTAYKSNDNTRIMFYVPGVLEGEQGRVYTIAYEGWEISGGVYMGVFQYMLDSFYFVE
ncbi:hypothetical protein C0580_01780 [Candidatus Parcubacteria bacterium]|nr:MAG: hypothetical protein C0580_01780 [Candidatus Parcubacteria bacterium]